jgi:hypothetical protein
MQPKQRLLKNNVSFVKSIFNFLRFNKRNWKAVVLCIFAATVFWFFNSLNKRYTTNLTFPVTFEYDHERFVPVKSLPASIRMNVTGSGWDLFRRSAGFKIPPLIIPLEKPTEVRKIVGTTLPGVFASQLERLQINFVITDTVHVSMDEMILRKFKVSLDSASQYIHPDYGLKNFPTITPDSILLSGPKEVINLLPGTLELTLKEYDLKKDYREEVELDLDTKESLTADPQRVTVSLDIVKFVTVDKRVRLSIINIPSRLKQSEVSKEIACTYRIPADETKTFSGDSLVAVIDLKNIPRGNHKLVPEIRGLPPQATLLKADTVLVNF